MCFLFPARGVGSTPAIRAYSFHSSLRLPQGTKHDEHALRSPGAAYRHKVNIKGIAKPASTKFLVFDAYRFELLHYDCVSPD
jgi:hypothetical protein